MHIFIFENIKIKVIKVNILIIFILVFLPSYLLIKYIMFDCQTLILYIMLIYSRDF